MKAKRTNSRSLTPAEGVGIRDDRERVSGGLALWAQTLRGSGQAEVRAAGILFVGL